MDDCPYRLWSFGDHWSTFDLKLASVSEDRELLPPMSDDDVIETGTEVLDRLSEKQRPMVGRRLPLNSEAVVKDLLRRAHFTLYPENVSLAVLEGAGFPADRLHVFYAPVELPLRGCHRHGVTSS